MPYQFRRLAREDVPALRRLRQVFASAFAEEEQWQEHHVSDSYVAEFLAHDNCIALVAEYETGEVVGGLIAHVLPKIDRVHSEIYLYDLAVAEAHRRQGIATQLIELLKIVAQHYHASTVFVQADNEDAAAVALYTRLADSIERDITHFDFSIKGRTDQAT